MRKTRPNICYRRAIQFGRGDDASDRAAGWAIEVDRDLCLGSGVCVSYAPRTFAHDEETKAVVLDPAGDGLGVIRTTVAACPSGALHFILHDGKEVN